MTTLPKVLTIVGPTSSGKTSLSIRLAEKFNGEVISADSRQVYRGLDLSSGKVTKEETRGVPHHLLDVADPMTLYAVSDFVRNASAAIDDIINRRRLPIIAGGTFLYTDTLLGRISPAPVPPNQALREKLDSQTNEELFNVLKRLDPERAQNIDQDNKRRLIRAIEIATALGKVPPTKTTSPYDTFIIGIDITPETLHHNIHVRLAERLEQGMVKEIEDLLTSGVTHDRLEDLGLECRYLSRYLRGILTYEEMQTQLETKIRQFAKRQMTWLKRDQSIHWFDPQDLAAENILLTELRTFLT